MGGRAHVPVVHMHIEAMAGRGETCRWMSAAAGASGDRVLASKNKIRCLKVTKFWENVCKRDIKRYLFATHTPNMLNCRTNRTTKQLQLLYWFDNAPLCKKKQLKYRHLMLC